MRDGINKGRGPQGERLKKRKGWKLYTSRVLSFQDGEMLKKAKKIK